MFVKQHIGSYLAEFVFMMALTAAACFFPLFSFLCMILLPAFFMLFSARRSPFLTIVYASLHLLFTVSILCVRDGLSVSALLDGALFAMSMSLSGLTMGLLISHTNSLLQIVVVGAGANLAVMLLQIGKMKWIDNINFMQTFVEQPISDMMQFYQSLYGTSVIPQDAIWLLQQAIGAVIPACFLIFSLYAAYFVFLLSRKLLFCRCRMVFAEIPHFWELQLPRSVAILFAVAFLLSTLLGMSQIGSAALNLALLLGSVFVLCGVSVIDYFFRRTGIVCGLRAVIYVIGFLVINVVTVILPLFNAILLLVLLGLADCFADLRKLRRKEADAQ